MDMSSDYLEDSEELLSGLAVRIAPAKNRFYLLEAVNDPIGKRSEQTETITVTLPDGTETTTTKTSLKYEQKFTFSAQLGFRWRDLLLRGGIKEGTGGIGVDTLLFRERIKLSLDAFDFADPTRDFRLLFRGKFYLNKNLYLSTGVNDIMNDDTRSVFLGGGVSWEDDDFKYLIGAAPSF
jgi:phospholipid/cholesterol/gamma-HCH transport system substrate-binding protein